MLSVPVPSGEVQLKIVYMHYTSSCVNPRNGYNPSLRILMLTEKWDKLRDAAERSPEQNQEQDLFISHIKELRRSLDTKLLTEELDFLQLMWAGVTFKNIQNWLLILGGHPGGLPLFYDGTLTEDLAPQGFKKVFLTLCSCFSSQIGMCWPCLRLLSLW